MVVGGAPVGREDHAKVIAQLALEMQQELVEFNAQAGRNMQLRIGISSGPVVAGVIGTSKFAYDIWGDSVNMASRMEGTCLADAIQVSEATYALLKNNFKFEHRGLVEIKGKGKVNTYLLKA
jgi:guanylate cyclase